MTITSLDEIKGVFKDMTIPEISWHKINQNKSRINKLNNWEIALFLDQTCCQAI